MSRIRNIGNIFSTDTTIATDVEVASAISDHNLDTTSVHGISDTADLATKTYAEDAANAVIPSKTNNSGKYLTTDGSSLSWATISISGFDGGSASSSLTTLKIRRDVSSNWTSVNPILNEGEIGIETDTLKVKLGDGGHWNSIINYINTVPSDLNSTLGDYVLISDINNSVAGLDGNQNLLIPNDSIIFEGATDNAYELTLKATDPTADRTLVLPDIDGTIATEGYVDSIISVFDPFPSQIGNNGKFLQTNGSSIAWSTVDLSTKQDIVSGVSSTEIGYLNGVTSNIQIQLADKPSYIDMNQAITALGNPIDVSAIGSAEGVAALDANKNLTVPGSSIIIEGAIDDAYQITLYVEGPTADRTLTFPDNSGIIALQSDITSAINDLTTTDIEEGANLYFTDARAQNAVATDLAIKAPLVGPTFTGTVVLPSSTSIGDVSSDEIGHLNGVSANIQTQIDNHLSDTINVHGIADTSLLATKSYVDNAASTAQTTAEEYADNVAASTLSTANGYTDNATADTLASANGYTDNAVSSAVISVTGYTDNAVSVHDSYTQNVHGIADTTKLVTTDGSQTLTNKTITSPLGLVKSDVGLGNVDNTSDANKPISTATQTALDLKAPLASPTFTGTVNAVDLILSGDLTISGTTTTVNTQDLVVADPMIYIGGDNQANLVDLGFVSSFNDGTYQHSGFVRDATDGKWKLFKGVTDEPATTVNFAQATLDTIAVGSIEATSATIGDVSNTELQYLNGVTSAIQTQIDSKAPTAAPTFTGIVTLPSTTSIGNVSATEIGYLDGVTSQVQSQLNNKDSKFYTFITESGTARTVTASTDAYGLLSFTSSSGVTVTVPNDSGEGANWPVGSYVDLIQYGTGQLTVAGASGVTVNATEGYKKSRVQFSTMTLIKVAANEWILTGDTAA